MLLKRSEINDVDIATSATPDDIKELFENVHPVGESFGVMLVVQRGIPFEVATFREDGGYQDGRRPEAVSFTGPEVDAQRRDFTINGMFYDPIAEQVHDFVGGQEDLRKGIIRTINNPRDRFSEDYLRMLRAIRFSTRFGFPIEEQTKSALLELAPKIAGISVERIFQEVDKMLTGPRPSEAVRLMAELGFLEVILPEVAALSGCEQPPEFHPEGDVFEHTMFVLDGLEKGSSSAVMWAALLHDIGKPPTKTVEDRIRFNNHNKVGAEMSDVLLRRLKVSNDLREKVVSMVAGHMTFVDVQQMRVSTLKRFIARETFNEELALHKADCLASNGSLSNYDFLQRKIEEFVAVDIAPKPFLNGKDLIQSGIRPSPLFGEILRDAYDLQLEETLKSREEALYWLKNRLAIEQID